MLGALLLLVNSGLNDSDPEDPRSLTSEFPPSRASKPNLKACFPLNHDSASSTCVSVMGVWTRPRLALLSDGVAGNRKGRERAGGDPVEADRSRQILARAEPLIDEFAAKVGAAEFVGQRRAEDMRVGAEQALDAHVGQVGQRIGRRDSVRPVLLVSLLLM